MKFIKTLLASVALIVAASSANAANYDLGVLSIGETYEEFSLTTKGTFNDVISFSITEDSLSIFGAGLLNIVSGGKIRQFIENFDVSLVDVENNVLGSGEDFTIPFLNAGSYKLLVSGNATGTSAVTGKYGINVEIAPVPEPSSVAMLLVGFAALGVAARRRKSL